MMMDWDRTRLFIGIAAFIACLALEYVFDVENAILLTVAIAGYVIVAYDVAFEMAENISKGRFFDEETLMVVATVGAFIVGAYTEALAVMVFFKIGEMLEGLAVYRSERSVMELVDLQPETANLLRDGEEISVPPSELKVGDIILVRPGEKVPADGRILKGESSMDTKNLTGESMPRSVSEGDTVYSGFVNISGVLKIEVVKEASESTAAKIIQLIEESENRKSVSEKFITVFSRYYTPFVILVALAIAVIPPVFFGVDWRIWFYRAMIMLVISCPCALVISVPLAFFCGIGRASTEGVLIKGSGYLEALSKADKVVMDKTGTVTKGQFRISSVEPSGIDREELLDIVSSVEVLSNHPVAIPFREITHRTHEISDVQERAGMGISAVVDGRQVLIGNERLMASHSVEVPSVDTLGVTLFVAAGGEYRGYVSIEDEIREDAAEAIHGMKEHGVSSVVMLTGDRYDVGRRVADTLGIDEVYADLLPSDKVSKVEEIMGTVPKGRKLVYVGDGMNDAPVLARSDVGIAMGGLGSDAAIEAADIVILSDRPSKVHETMHLSEKVMRIVWTNVILALMVKAAFMILDIMGLITMWEGVFADVGMLIILVLNSVRIMGKGSIRSLFTGDYGPAEIDGCPCGCCDRD